MTALFVNRDDVVGVEYGFEIQYERGIAVGAQSRRGQHRSFKTVRRVFTQHKARRKRGVGQMIRHVIKKTLDSIRSFQAAELAKFGGSEHVERIGHRVKSKSRARRNR